MLANTASRHVGLTIAYHGAGFLGWQKQPQGRTVQTITEAAISQIVQHDVRLKAAGRTDSGVHARGQVASFVTTSSSVPYAQFYRAINTKLPPDVRIRASFLVPMSFDARRHAVRRIYRYRLLQATTADPLLGHYAVTLPKLVSLNRLNALARLFVGRHDFTAFCSSHDANNNKVRTIYQSYFVEEGPFISYHIEGNAFLMNMVRAIIGTILDYYSHNDAEQKIRTALTTQNRALCGTVAKAYGLTLEAVIYNAEYAPFLSY